MVLSPLAAKAYRKSYANGRGALTGRVAWLQLDLGIRVTAKEAHSTDAQGTRAILRRGRGHAGQNSALRLRALRSPTSTTCKPLDSCAVEFPIAGIHHSGCGFERACVRAAVPSRLSIN